MKKTILLFLFLVFANVIFSQSKVEKVEEFFEEIECKEILDQGFSGIKYVIDSNKEKLFDEFQLDFGNKGDVQEFDSFLREEIDLIKGEAYVYISEKYSRHYDEKELQKFIALAKTNKSKKEILIETNFKIELDSILEFQGRYLQNNIRLILTKIRAKYKPLILNSSKRTRNKHFEY